MLTFDAIYKAGAFVPVNPMTMPENERVSLSLNTTAPESPTEMSEEEFERRLSLCKTVEDLVEFGKTLPPDDGSYQMEAWIDESRRETGFRMPMEPR